MIRVAFSSFLDDVSEADEMIFLTSFPTYAHRSVNFLMGLIDNTHCKASHRNEHLLNFIGLGGATNGLHGSRVHNSPVIRRARAVPYS